MRRHADHHRDAERSRRGRRARRRPVMLLVGGQQVRDDDREQRRRGVEDRGEAARDMALAPDDQRERDGVVEGGHAGKGEPSLAGPGKLQSERAQHDEEGERGDPDAQGDDGQGWKLPERHGDEQEGPAPDDRQRDEKRPFPRAHDGLDAGRRNEIRFRIVHPCRFTPLHRIGDPFSAVRTGRTRCRPGCRR